MVTQTSRAARRFRDRPRRSSDRPEGKGGPSHEDRVKATGDTLRAPGETADASLVAGARVGARLLRGRRRRVFISHLRRTFEPDLLAQRSSLRTRASATGNCSIDRRGRGVATPVRWGVSGEIEESPCGGSPAMASPCAPRHGTTVRPPNPSESVSADPADGVMPVTLSQRSKETTTPIPEISAAAHTYASAKSSRSAS